MRAAMIALLAGVVLAAGCTVKPSGPRVMVLPGEGKQLEEFDRDDASCRGWATERLAISPEPWSQRQYDVAYMQCMYAAGHQIPMAARGADDAPPAERVDVPPPPPGRPPPPPPWRTPSATP
jgi:hypothetical protein